MEELTTTAAVIRALGGNTEVATLTRRKYNAVSNWNSKPTFPPDTADAMRGALQEKGYTAPASLWRMVEAS